jgi:hypothetical protein
LDSGFVAMAGSRGGRNAVSERAMDELPFVPEFRKRGLVGASDKRRERVDERMGWRVWRR